MPNHDLSKWQNEREDALVIEPEPLYYIQNTGYCGNCLKWWRVDGHGYTMNLDEAWKLPESKARQICRSRPQEDIAWPAAKIDALASRHLNIEVLSAADAKQVEPLRKEALDALQKLSVAKNQIALRDAMIDQLTRELDESRLDTARLDWLEKILADEIYYDDVVLQSDYEDGVWVSLRNKGIHCLPVTGQEAKADTLRAALDSARKSPPENVSLSDSNPSQVRKTAEQEGM